MCAILGILSSNPQHFACYEEQLRSLRHRGPDDQGNWANSHVLLGSCRLSIIDIAGGHQPIFNENNTCCIVYNGELYNFLDLRGQLEAKGYKFRTHTDTEVVLHGYEEWGVECLKRFNGMFAFAIWDERKKMLFVARDRIGEKPLYYFQGKDRLIVASEMKSIVTDLTVPRIINPRGLANYLSFGHGMAPDTIYKDIFKLLPGHYLIAKNGHLEIAQYWDVGDESQIPRSSKFTQGEYIENILSLLDDSVRRRMIADVPVGAFLSGGVDSSAIVSMMKRHATGSVKTFSLGFSIGGAYDELSDARKVSSKFGTEHYELKVGHLDLVETLQKLIYYYDEPFGDPANFPVYLLSDYARKHVKVVLTGDGGDELFGGYRRYAAEQIAPLYQKLPGVFVGQLFPIIANSLPRFRRIKRIFSTLSIADPARRYAAWLQVFNPEMQSDLLQPDVLNELTGYDPTWPYSHYYNQALNREPSFDHLNRILYVDVKTWLADAYMEKVDKATMSVGLEARLPFLDHRLVELAFQIPGDLKIRGLTTKHILKEALKKLLPREILNKPKHGFAVPTDHWFRGELKTFVFEILMDERTRKRGYFKTSTIERIYRAHLAGKRVYDLQLWLMLNFELWNRIYMDNKT